MYSNVLMSVPVGFYVSLLDNLSLELFHLEMQMGASNVFGGRGGGGKMRINDYKMAIIFLADEF